MDLRSPECLVQLGVTSVAPAALRMAFITLREKDAAWPKKKCPCLWKPRARFGTRGHAIIWYFESTRLNEIWAIPGFRLAKISRFPSPGTRSPSLPFSTPHPQATSFIPCNSPVPHSPAEFGLGIQVSSSSSKGTSLLHGAASNTAVKPDRVLQTRRAVFRSPRNKSSEQGKKGKNAARWHPRHNRYTTEYFLLDISF